MATFVIIGIIFVGLTVFGTIIYALAGFIKNNNSPIDTVDAKVISKRTEVHSYGDSISDVHTEYYVTFELSTTGERKEFHVRPNIYGTLTENDLGFLTYQGTRFKNFERN